VESVEASAVDLAVATEVTEEAAETEVGATDAVDVAALSATRRRSGCP
jgi:hypothetical protein